MSVFILLITKARRRRVTNILYCLARYLGLLNIYELIAKRVHCQ